MTAELNSPLTPVYMLDGQPMLKALRLYGLDVHYGSDGLLDGVTLSAYILVSTFPNVDPTGATECSVALRTAIAAGAGGLVVFSAGTYLIDGTFHDGFYGLGAPPDNTHVLFQKGAKLKIKTTTSGQTIYFAFMMVGATGVTIEGAEIEGDRLTRSPAICPNGIGVGVYHGTTIKLIDLNIHDCGGDGILVTGDQITDALESTDVEITRPRIDNCGRNGISSSSCLGLKITDPHITNINGQLPEYGIDLEMESATRHLTDVLIDGGRIEDCAGVGIGVIPFAPITSSLIDRLAIQKTRFRSNGGVSGGARVFADIRIEGTPMAAQITDTQHDDSGDFAILCRVMNGVVVKGAQVHDGRGNGIYLDRCVSSVVQGNNVARMAARGIADDGTDTSDPSGSNNINGNSITGCGTDGTSSNLEIISAHVVNTNVQGNVLRGNGPIPAVGVKNAGTGSVIASNDLRGAAGAQANEFVDTGSGTLTLGGNALTAAFAPGDLNGGGITFVAGVHAAFTGDVTLVSSKVQKVLNHVAWGGSGGTDFDLTDNGNAAQRPGYTSGVSFDFDESVPQWMVSAAHSITGPCTFLCKAKFGSGVTNTYLTDSINGSTGRLFGILKSGSQWKVRIYSAGASFLNAPLGQVVPNTFYRMGGVYNATASQVQVYGNAITATPSADIGPGTASGWTMGSGASGAQPLTGSIVWMLLYAGALTPAQITTALYGMG